MLLGSSIDHQDLSLSLYIHERRDEISLPITFNGIFGFVPDAYCSFTSQRQLMCCLGIYPVQVRQRTPLTMLCRLIGGPRCTIHPEMHYPSSSDFPPSFSLLANWLFQRLFACSAFTLGNTKSKTSENQLAAWPSIPSLMFCYTVSALAS